MEPAMRKDELVDLTRCTEFRQTLQARPPRIVHGTLVLVVTLLGSALLWSGLTTADLVVRAGGRVRPAVTPTKVVSAGRAEVLSASAGGRVVEVNFREGDQVRRGQVLVRLDTGHLDNEISKRRRTIQAGEEELSKVLNLEQLAAKQFDAVKAKAEAELRQAREEIRLAKERRRADVELARSELETAQDEEARLQRLAAHKAAPEADRVKARANVREAGIKLEKARLPVEESRVQVLRQTLALAARDHAMKCEELGMKRVVKQGEVEAARKELGNLELERRQAVLQAPIDGIVTAGEVKVGDILETGKSVVEIAAQKGFRFEVAVPSEEVAHLRVGMPARIRLDAYDYQKYGTLEGRVCFISPDSGVPEGQKAAQYVVRIELSGDEVGRGGLGGRVKLGMAGQAEIITDAESLLSLLVNKIRRTISLG
jgi:multidrug resistance efflux pump